MTNEFDANQFVVNELQQQLRIRPYRDSDKAAVVALILSIQQQEFGVAITAEAQPDLNAITEFYQSGNGNFWVACSHEKIVGTIALLDIECQQVALRKMFVVERYRGADQGVAKALLDQAEAWAKRRAVVGIFLGTINVYQAAMRFYEKNGYERIGKCALPEAFPLIAVDNVFYHKSIESRVEK